MDAYLVEARSTGGISGSPVFYHRMGSPVSALRPFAQSWLSPIGTPQTATDGDVKAPVMQSLYLIGIVQGHYNQKAMPDDVPDADRDDIEELNTGIAIVVPIAKVLDFIDATRARLGS